MSNALLEGVWIGRYIVLNYLPETSETPHITTGDQLNLEQHHMCRRVRVQRGEYDIVVDIPWNVLEKPAIEVGRYMHDSVQEQVFKVWAKEL